MSAKAASGQGKARVRREAKRRGPLVNENTKKALFMKGPKTSDIIVHAMKDLHRLKAPDAKLFSRKNDIRPFEDTQSLEFLCHKNDTSLFCVCSHTKKRPMTLVLGRMFNWTVLDMFELTLSQYRAMDSFESQKAVLGNKPAFVFLGDKFDHDDTLKQFRSFLVDFFRGREVSAVNLVGVDHVIVVTTNGDKVFLRVYFVSLAAENATAGGGGKGSVEPELTEMGPRLDFRIGRTQIATMAARRPALKRPATVTGGKKQKNVSSNLLGEKVGRIHVHNQNLESLAVRKFVGLKGTRGNARDTPEEADGGAAKRGRKSE